ncbi:MAG: signal peptidase I [Candidatus Paceibacterota bacterium]|jgi:signal peptidase I
MDTQPLEFKKEHVVWETIKFIIIALVIVIPIRMYVAQPFIVSGQSMEPTFDDRQYLIVDQLTYHFQNPQRGDVVIFKYPNDTTKYFIKRVIGLPGEKVEVRAGHVTIFNTENPTGELLVEPYVGTTLNDADRITTLGADEYFVMGDNRSNSSDSRVWGPLKQKFLVGRPILRLLPLNTISVFPGKEVPQENKVN